MNLLAVAFTPIATGITSFILTACWANSAAILAVTNIRLTIDGVAIRVASETTTVAAGVASATLVYNTTLSLAAHTIGMDWAVSAGTSTIDPTAATPLTSASMLVTEHA